MLIPILLIAASLLLFIGAIYFFLYEKRQSSKKSPVKDLFPRLTQKEELKLLSVINSLSDGLIVVDNLLRLWIINNSARTFLNIKSENPTFDEVASYLPVGINLHDKVKEIIGNSSTITLHEVEINNKTFQIFITSIQDKNITDKISDNSLYSFGASILFQDITAEKRIEKVKEEFSHIIVHELRAPVVAIKNSASLILSGEIGETEQRNILNLISDQAKKLLDQISYILDAGKVEEGKLTLNKGLGDLGRVIKEGVELFLPEAKRKNITLTTKIGNDLPNFYFDNNRIVEVINNLISNSLKYTNDFGFVKIGVDTDDRYKATKSEGRIVITVSDNGIGIPIEKQNLLFRKFSELNNNKVSDETKKVSSGLGLYITKGIIEAHGGQISVNSAAGKGTVVSFTLPIVIKNEIEIQNRVNLTSPTIQQ